MNKLEAKASVKTNEVFHELLETERSYVTNLRIIVEIFLKPLREQNILTKIQLSNIFSNVETIYQQVNTPLLEHLEQITSEDRIAEIGEVFVEYASLFKLYAVYCSNQPNIHKRVSEFKKESDAFSEFLKNAQRIPDCRKLDIESFLITPLQRLCKYPLLLRELIKCSIPGSHAHTKLSLASESIGEIVSKVNERVRKIENINKLISVNNGITFSPSCTFDLLSDHNRIFQMDEIFLYNFKQVHAYLFSDVILFARETDSGVFQVNEYILLHGCKVINVPSIPEEEKKEEIEFLERGQEIGHIFTFSSTFKKKRWLKTLETLLSEINAKMEMMNHDSSKIEDKKMDDSETPRTRGSKVRLKRTRSRSLKRISGTKVKSIALQFESKTPEPARKYPKKPTLEKRVNSSVSNLKDMFTNDDYKKKYEEEKALRFACDKSYQAQIKELEDIIAVLRNENEFLKDLVRDSNK